MRKVLALSLAVALVGAGGCARNQKPATEAEASAPATLRVRNMRFYDMDVYVVRTGGSRTRLGTVSGNGNAQFTIPRYVVGFGGLLRFVADPIGPSGVSRSEELTVRPGDVVSIDILP